MWQVGASSEDSFGNPEETGDGQSTLIECGASELVFAKEERDGLLHSLTRLEKFAEDSATSEYEQIEARLKRLGKCWEQFERISREIRRLDNKKNKKSNDAIYGDFDERVCVLTGRLKSMQRNKMAKTGDVMMCVNDSEGSSKVNVKLPKMALPEFGGKFDEWLPFKDMYEQMVHNNASLSKVEKLYYLKSSLKSDALKAIEAYPICAASYDAAWDTLLSRFSNPYLQRKRHANELLNWPRMKKSNAVNINAVIDGFERHTKLLRQLGETPEAWGIILTQLLTSKLDEHTQREWERSVEQRDNAGYYDLIQFLRGQVRILEALGEDKSEVRSQPISSFKAPKLAIHLTSEERRIKCSVCDADHATVSCEQFLSMTAKERLKVARAKELCLNCLSKGHFWNKCHSKVRCRACKRSHHSLLHMWYPKADAIQYTSVQTSNCVSESFDSEAQGTNHANATLTMAVKRSTVSCGVLSTVLVNVKGKNGKLFEARALLDSGSQLNVLTEKLCEKLGLERRVSGIKLTGIGKSDVNSGAAVTAEVMSKTSKYARLMEFLVMSGITHNLQPVQLPDECIPCDGEMADPGWNTGGEIDMLLGSEYFFEFLALDGGRPGIYKVNDSHPYFVNTVFGWVLSGPKRRQEQPSAVCSHVSMADQIERFWSIEEVRQEDSLTQDEKDCEQSFVQTHSRDETGRYIVKLPMKFNSSEMIGESFMMAKKRYLQLENRLMKEEELRASYNSVIKQYIDLGYLVEVFPDSSQNTSTNIKQCYLPHHPVVKQSSSSTKVRPVFDGSAKMTKGFSLNDCLLNGPVLQDSLFNLMIRFRTFAIALVADVEKMYLQVRVDAEHTPLQRILWRDSQQEDIRHYELQRVTFGLTPSSFLATRVLFQLAADEGEQFPLGKRALQECFYVDDYIGGATSESEAVQLVKELRQLLEKGGFNLRKWNSNVPSTLRDVSASEKDQCSQVRIGPADQVKTLGVYWDPETDKLGVTAQIDDYLPVEHHTRRSVFSFIAKLFDPLGLIAPVIAWAKVFMQRLWIATKEWDDPIPQDLADQWDLFQEQTCHIQQIRVPRYVLLPRRVTTQLHCFADASEIAYGACVYLRVIDQENHVKVVLLAAKSKVAPLKKLSLPRLELCAAVIGAKLWKAICDALKEKTMESYFWSDSTIVLNWLRSPSYTWATFVGNRVATVQDLTKGHHWQHVKGSENPADILSRGALPSQLSDVWFKGPPWLSNCDSAWSFPEDTSGIDESRLERKRRVLLMAECAAEHPLLDRYSSYWKCGRVTAYCLRFIQKCRKKPVSAGPVTSAEFKKAVCRLVVSLQRIEFPIEMQTLAKGRELPKKSKLRKLRPFLDSEGLMRVGGRLSQTNLPFNSKHPMLLPAKGNFTRIVARAYHEMSLHGGPRLTLASMRQDYWPLNRRVLANFIHRSCLTCFKANPKTIVQPTGQLPEKRVTPSRPFKITGIDYCGPVYLKPVHRRAAAQKAYIAVFVCFCTKAVHLELVEDLTTSAFLATFRRFISRRGCPSDIYSDNGLNFRGAQRELTDLYRLLSDDSFQIATKEQTMKYGITWHFIPPRAPNFGGLWEAAVKSAKKTLTKLFASQQLSFAEMSTVLTQIEAQLNSRPLTPLSEDPGELNVLTPGHFLIGTSLMTLPDVNHVTTPENRLRHFDRLQQLVQRHWQQWQKEYVCELHNVNQGVLRKNDIGVGQMVIVKEDLQPNEWCLGRVIGIHPGRDNVVRVVTVKTSKGIYKRPVSRICLLPSENEGEAV